MDEWRAVAHGLAGGGAAGVLLWGVMLFVSLGAGGASPLPAALALLAGLLLSALADMAGAPR